MKILITAASILECKHVIDEFFIAGQPDRIFHHIQNHEIQLFISGIGILESAVRLTSLLSKSEFDLVYNIGFCGSLSETLALGQIVKVTADSIADMGILTDLGNFNHLLELKSLASELEFYAESSSSVFPEQMNKYPEVIGITVNSCTNNSIRADYFIKEFSADIETMEGAAIKSVCHFFSIPSLQIRTVSNIIPGREPEKWNIALAKSSIKNIICEISDIYSSK